MQTTFEQLSGQAVVLLPRDRARAFYLFLASLPDATAEPLDEAWEQEIQRRLKVVESGMARLVSASDAHAEARKIYQRFNTLLLQQS